jgi:uncharacterized protein (TIGR04255 family)
MSMYEAYVESYGESQIQRLGLRYQNVIRPSKLGLNGIPWRNLVRKELLSVLSDPEVSETEIIATDSAFVAQLEPFGNVTFRTALVQESMSDEKGVLIDADYWSEERVDSGIVELERQLQQLHGHAYNAFRWAITERVHLALQPTAIQPIG